MGIAMDIDFAAEAWLGDCQYCLVDEDQMLFYTPINEEMSAVQYASQDMLDARSDMEASVREGSAIRRLEPPPPDPSPTPVPPAPEPNPPSPEE